MEILMRNVDHQGLEYFVSLVLRTPALILLNHCYNGFYDDKAHETADHGLVVLQVKLLLLLLCAVVMLLLPLGAMLTVFWHLLALILLSSAQVLSQSLAHTEYQYLETSDWLPAFVSLDAAGQGLSREFQMGAMVCLSVMVPWILQLNQKLGQLFVFVNLSPCLVHLVGLPEAVLDTFYLYLTSVLYFSTLLYLLYLAVRMVMVVSEWSQMAWLMVTLYGFFQSVFLLLVRCFDPGAMVCYWCVMFVWNGYIVANTLVGSVNPLMLLMLVISSVCDSPLNLIASCLTVMLFGQGIVWLLSLYLNSCHSHVSPSTHIQACIHEGALMFLLSLQVELIDLELDQRVYAMTTVMLMVAMCLLQSLIDITHPVLLALSSSKNVLSHVKVLALCLLLFLTPSYISYLLMNALSSSVWIIVVVSDGMLMAFQVLGHVIHYALYMYDINRSQPWEALDDVIYYLKAVINSLEFISSLFIIVVGVSEVVAGQSSHFHFVVLSIHCYFNIWVRIKKGWSSFLKRQAAMAKIQSMDDATLEQLRTRDDVCAICYSEMRSKAKVTPCGHFFHSSCLKKWLYLQDQCPMCSSKVINSQLDDGDQNTDVEELDDQLMEETL